MHLCTSLFYAGLGALYGPSVLRTLPASVHCTVWNACNSKGQNKVHPRAVQEDPERGKVDT